MALSSCSPEKPSTTKKIEGLSDRNQLPLGEDVSFCPVQPKGSNTSDLFRYEVETGTDPAWSSISETLDQRSQVAVFSEVQSAIDRIM